MELNRAGRQADRRAPPARPSGSRGGARGGPRPRRQAQAARRASSSRSSPTAAEQVAEQIDRRVARAEDHRPAGVDRRPGRAADPQGQARQADRVRVRRPDLRGDREHPQRRPRIDPPGRRTARATRPRTRCCRRPQPSSTGLGIRPREIVARRRVQPGPTSDAFPDLEPTRSSRRPPRTRLPPDPQTPSPLPHRDRGPDQPPQTQLRTTPHPG